MLLPVQWWVRILCAFIGGLVLAWSPLTVLGIKAVAHTRVDIEVHPGTMQPVTARDWGFSLQDYVVEHQWMKNTVNITVNYTLKEDVLTTHPDNLTLLFNHIIQFLIEYPNEDDYWEIVNRHLTQTMLQEHSELRSLTVSLEILPRPMIPYTCTSTVAVTDQNQMIETWQFVSTHIPVHHQARELVNLSVRYTYQSGIIAQDYPDFVPIQHQIAETLMVYPDSLDSWEIIDRQLAETILAEHSTLTDVTVELEALSTSKLPYAYATSVSLTQAQS